MRLPNPITTDVGNKIFDLLLDTLEKADDRDIHNTIGSMLGGLSGALVEFMWTAVEEDSHMAIVRDFSQLIVISYDRAKKREKIKSNN